MAEAKGQHERAATLMGAAERLCEGIGAPVYLERAWHERTLVAVRAALDPAHFAAAWAEGKAMDLEQAIAYALDEGQTYTTQPTPLP